MQTVTWNDFLPTTSALPSQMNTLSQCLAMYLEYYFPYWTWTHTPLYINVNVKTSQFGNKPNCMTTTTHDHVVTYWGTTNRVWKGTTDTWKPPAPYSPSSRRTKDRVGLLFVLDWRRYCTLPNVPRLPSAIAHRLQTPLSISVPTQQHSITLWILLHA